MLVVLVIIFPFLWIVISSFKSPDHFLSLEPRATRSPARRLASYALALGETSLLRWMVNSFLVAIRHDAALAADLRARGLRARPPALPRARAALDTCSFLLRDPLDHARRAALRRARDARPERHLLGLILVHASFTIPFVTWVLTDFYALDPGRSRGGRLRRRREPPRACCATSILPLSVPGLLAAGAYAFILSWNDFLFAFIILNDQQLHRAGRHQRVLHRAEHRAVLWAELMAASVLVTLPSVILFGLFQRYLVRASWPDRSAGSGRRCRFAGRGRPTRRTCGGSPPGVGRSRSDATAARPKQRDEIAEHGGVASPALAGQGRSLADVRRDEDPVQVTAGGICRDPVRPPGIRRLVRLPDRIEPEPGPPLKDGVVVPLVGTGVRVTDQHLAQDPRPPLRGCRADRVRCA